MVLKPQFKHSHAIIFVLFLTKSIQNEIGVQFKK